MAGYANGLFGLWALGNGTRLLRETLHGAISAVQSVGSVVQVGSGLGQIRSVDLGAFAMSYCELRAEVAASVPVTWKDGVPAIAPDRSRGQCSAAHADHESSTGSAH
jgi:hypothetical protein